MATPARFEPLPIAGAWEIFPKRHEDPRGWLLKPFEQDLFAQHGLPTSFAEDLVSHSQRNVLRGLHFQTPPQGQAKLVGCLKGEILDVLVDLRVGSPSYRQVVARVLSPAHANALFAPVGLAHGFIVLSETAIVHYKCTQAFSPAHDGGIRWDSVSFDWPVAHPLLSAKDEKLPRLDDFASPFRWEGPG